MTGSNFKLMFNPHPPWCNRALPDNGSSWANLSNADDFDYKKKTQQGNLMS
jgi:hypothetical protein